MKFKRFTPALIAAALMVAPVTADAQSQPAPSVPDSVQQMMMEFQQLQQQLGQIQQQALAQDASLKEKQDAVQETVEQAMQEMAPGIEQKIDRLEALPAEIQAAQGDQATMQALLAEGQALQQEVQAAQAEAVQREDVAREIEYFRAELLAGMSAVEPTTPQLVSRLEALAERLQAALAS